MNKKILFGVLFAFALALIFSLSSASAVYYHDGYGNYYSKVIKSSPYEHYEKVVYEDPWSYRSSIRITNYESRYRIYPSYYYGHGYGYRGYPTYYSSGYYNRAYGYWNYGYRPPQYVEKTIYRNY